MLLSRDQLHTLETKDFFKQVIKMNVKGSPPLTNARMLDKLVDQVIESA